MPGEGFAYTVFGSGNSFLVEAGQFGNCDDDGIAEYRIAIIDPPAFPGSCDSVNLFFFFNESRTFLRVDTLSLPALACIKKVDGATAGTLFQLRLTDVTPTGITFQEIPGTIFLTEAYEEELPESIELEDVPGLPLGATLTLSVTTADEDTREVSDEGDFQYNGEETLCVTVVDDDDSDDDSDEDSDDDSDDECPDD